MKIRDNYTTKTLIIFPLMAIFLLILTLTALFEADNRHKKYLIKESDISWALNNPRPEKIRNSSFHSTDYLIKELKADIAKWDAIHADLSAAKEEAIVLSQKVTTARIPGLFAAFFACWFLYKTCRFSIPVAIKATKRMISQSTTTLIRRLGVLLLAVACIFLIWGIFIWNSYWGRSLFDLDYFHGILSFLGVVFFIAGIILSSGMAERLVRWIKHGN